MTETERRALEIESYRQQSATWMHENAMLYVLTSIFIPLSIAALGAPYLNKSIPSLISTAGGLILITYWGVSCEVLEAKMDLRFLTINRMEGFWGVEGHQVIRRRMNATYGKLFKNRRIRRFMFGIYSSIVFLLTLYEQYRPYSDKKPSTFLIDKHVDFVMISLCWVISLVVFGWALYKVHQKIKL